MLKSDIVIIGAGHAGGMVSIFLRKLKYKGKITIVGDEKYLPYQRPELSKGFLFGNIDESRLFLKKDETRATKIWHDFEITYGNNKSIYRMLIHTFSRLGLTEEMEK